jgi:hypothetical protein
MCHQFYDPTNHIPTSVSSSSILECPMSILQQQSWRLRTSRQIRNRGPHIAVKSTSATVRLFLAAISTLVYWLDLCGACAKVREAKNTNSR